jgi:hypothetical protein
MTIEHNSRLQVGALPPPFGGRLSNFPEVEGHSLGSVDSSHCGIEKSGVATGRQGAMPMIAPRDSKPRERLLWESPIMGQPGDFRSCLVGATLTRCGECWIPTCAAGRSRAFYAEAKR